jgi:hypothetical protein
LWRRRVRANRSCPRDRRAGRLTRSDSDAGTCADAGTYAGSRRDAYPGGHADADLNACRHPGTDSRADCNPNPRPDTNPHTGADTHTRTYA